MRYIFVLFLGICCGNLQSKISVQSSTLANGLKVVVLKNPLLPCVTVYTKYDVGTADDPAEVVGLSHMLEHMMFKGSRKYPVGSIDNVLNSCGGHSNAHTTFDTTVYTFSLPAEYLDTALDIEADRMENLDIDEKAFLSEQKVVLEERRMRLGNHAFKTAAEILRRSMFTAHPYGIFPIGYEAHIKAYTTEALTAHYKKWYAPNNATIIVIGPYDLDYVLPKIEEKFASIAARDIPERKRIAEPDREGLTTTIEQENARSENIYITISYRAPTLIKKPEAFFVMGLLQATLCGNQNGSLYQKMVKEKSLALSVSCRYAYGEDDMDFSFSLMLDPVMNVEKAEQFLFEQLGSFLKNGLLKKDFENAKLGKKNALDFALDGESFLIAVADRLVEGLPFEAVTDYEKLLDAVTLDQAHKMLKFILAKPPVVIARYYPKGKMPKRSYHNALVE